MKKNISINIGGIIFHIEEDGFEKLKEYLESINKYFSSFDDSTEIIADIESRIAEIFLSKLNESKQVITGEDVQGLISTMGSIQDFQAAEEEIFANDPVPESKTPREEYSSASKDDKYEKQEGHKKLYRDSKHKLLGGVASGIANYFSIDPLWIRLLFIVLVFDIFLTFSISSLAIIGYIVMWIVLPESDKTVEDKKTKKMYRNPDDRVLGGVASGVAAYFAADAVIIRLLFVLSIFLGGTGLIVYIILWIILPEASTITDKVEMKGEPVTLSNIESNIKGSLHLKEDNEDESKFTKIILLPFRIIALIISGLSKALGPLLLFLVDAIRIFAGFVMSIVGVALIFSLVILAGVLMGLLSGAEFVEIDGFPVNLLEESLPIWGIVATFISIGIPSLVLILLGISVIGKTRTINPAVGWSMFAIWILSLVGLGLLLPSIASDFRREGIHSEVQTFDLDNRTAILKLNERGLEDYHVTNLRLRGHDGNEFRLVKEFEARGRSKQDAIENAQMISYNVELRNDSILLFDENISFRSDAQFRGQKLDMTLYIPFNHPFIMHNELRQLIYNTIGRYNYRPRDMGSHNTWIFTPSGLECTTCDRRIQKRDSRNESDPRALNENDYSKEYDLVGFNRIEIEGPYKINIDQAEDYKVTIYGSKSEVDDLRVRKLGSRLDIDYEFDISNFTDNNEIEINVSLPDLESIELRGPSNTSIRGFNEAYMKVKMTAGAAAEIISDIEELSIELTGATKLDLNGKGNELTAKIRAASNLDAYRFEVKEATVEARTASEAKLFVTEILEISSNLGSEINYRGNPRVIREN